MKRTLVDYFKAAQDGRRMWWMTTDEFERVVDMIDVSEQHGAPRYRLSNPYLFGLPVVLVDQHDTSQYCADRWPHLYGRTA